MKCKIRVFLGYLWEDARDIPRQVFLGTVLGVVFGISIWGCIYLIKFLWESGILIVALSIGGGLFGIVFLYQVVSHTIGYFRGIYQKTQQDCFDK